ncbi:MAG: dienelactone hydrolase family protein [Gemmatimonadaceae bacterium]
MSNTNALHQGRPRLIGGAPLASARVAIVLAHGRGADAEDMMSFGQAVADDTVALIALRAANNTWYPERFMEPIASNEPWLSSALQAVHDAVEFVKESGIPNERIVLMGFSQGACLSLEYAARNATRFGGIVGVAGGLIGPDSTPRNYAGLFDNSPVFLGCGDRDPHIPVARVQLTKEVFTKMGAQVDARIYEGLQHVVVDDEVNAVRKLVASIPAVA